jgi:hypothetical protein
MDAVKSALDRNANADELERLTNELHQVWQQVGTRMYQAAGPGPQTPPPGAGPQAGPGGGEDVVDGEYRKV